MPRWLLDLFQILSRPFEPLPPPTPQPEPTPTPSPSPLGPIPSPAPIPDLATGINAARAAAGLPALIFDEALGQVSESWARSMASNGALDHGAFADRIATLYPNTAAGEDIAEGQPTAAEVVAAWMDDPPHRANILGSFNRFGIGSAEADDGTPYWCADFVDSHAP